MFWDSRALGLEAQSLLPPTSHNEMAGSAYAAEDAIDSVIARLVTIPEYVTLFNGAFGGGVASVTSENFAKAIAAFERTIVSTNSPFDQYARGDKTALTDAQKRGLILFYEEANCGDCHRGAMFSDFKLTVHGAKDNTAGNFPDTGADDEYKFKTPTLRNIELTAPYTHGGVYATLGEALQFYNVGKSDNPNIDDTQLDIHVQPINLPQSDLDDLEEFLKALTDDSFDKKIPESVPSGLPVGGNLN